MRLLCFVEWERPSPKMLFVRKLVVLNFKRRV